MFIPSEAVYAELPQIFQVWSGRDFPLEFGLFLQQLVWLL